MPTPTRMQDQDQEQDQDQAQHGTDGTVGRVGVHATHAGQQRGCLRLYADTQQGIAAQ